MRAIQSTDPLRDPLRRLPIWFQLALTLPLLIAALGPLAPPVQAQEMDAPVAIQMPLLYKILSFDRKLGLREPGTDIVIAVVFQAYYRPSVVAREEVVYALQQLKDSTIFGHPVHWVALELNTAESLKLALLHNRVDVIYVTPLRGVDLEPIKVAARAAGITTFTGVAQYVERGLALGVGVTRERLQIIVNLTAARAEGSDFGSQLLRVSKVVE